MTPVALRALATGIALVAIVTGAYQFGRHVKTGEVAQEKLQDAEVYAQRVREKQEIADGLAAENAALRARQIPKDRLITKEITRYVDVTPAALRCTLPGSWRVRHDAAATGLLTDADGGSLAPGAGGDVEDSAALETVSENYTTARDCIARLDGWQRRYRALEQSESAP